MNGSKQLIDNLVASLNKGNWGDQVEVAIAPPSCYLDLVRQKTRADIHVSSQNLFCEASGAYTGELAPSMLKDLNVQYAILGHSERREIFGESDELVAKKVAFAIQSDIKVILCIGEKLAEREANETTTVVFRQLNAVQKVLKPSDWDHVVIAYEPVWAIGTGKVATPQQAQEVHVAIRGWLADHVSSQVAETTRIIYGGSVNAKNCGLLQQEKDIDGFLVGGASLKGDEFSIITHCRQ